MFFYLKWYVKKRTSASGLDDRHTEIIKLIADIDRITDRDSQLVEDRINKLRTIMEETDKRIAVYLKELEKSKTSEAIYKSLGQGIRAALETAPADDETQGFPQDTIKLSSASRTVRQENPIQSEPSRQSFSQVMEASLEEEPAQQDNPLPPPSRQQIRTYIDLLISEGLSAQEIASRLGISIAEVNLAMNLQRGRS